MANYPSAIGGQDIDVSQIGMSLQSAIKDEFPINDVPESILAESIALVRELTTAERNIMRLIDMVRTCDGHGDFMR